jgi:hypothetical protein
MAGQRRGGSVRDGQHLGARREEGKEEEVRRGKWKRKRGNKKEIIKKKK